MHSVELRTLSPRELQTRLEAERMHLEDLREKLAQKKLENVREIRSARKGIARILTILNERPQ